MSPQISGLKILSRFGWPCAQEKLDHGLMRQSDFDELKSCIENNVDPDVLLLALCFPSLMRGLGAFAREHHRGMLAYDVVIEFLKQHQGSGGTCAAKVGRIISDNWNGTFDVICGNSILKTQRNFFSIDLDPALPVLIHRTMIVTQI